MTDIHFAGAERAAGYGPEEENPAAEAATEPAPSPALVEAHEATHEPAPVLEASGPVPAREPVADAGPGVTFPASPGDMLVGLTRASLRASQQPVAKNGWRGFWAKLGVKAGPSAAERTALEAAAALRRDEEIIRQATYTRPVGVLVANPKGNAGKTTVSLALGGVVASVRGGGVAIVEVAEDPGTLTLRAEGNPRRGLGQLIQDAATVTNAGQLDGYMAPQTSFARVIGSTGPRPSLTSQSVTAVLNVVDEFYALRVMDSGNQYTSPAFAAAIAAADVLVIPTLNATDSATQAIALLDALRVQGGHAADLADRAVVLVLTDGRLEIPAVVEGVKAAFELARVAAVLPIPFDTHLAERGQITVSELHPDTYRAFVAAGAAVIRALEPIT